MRALLARRGEDGSTEVALTDAPLREAGTGDVVVKVSHSSINYKDALAVTGAPGILRTLPLVPGVDLVGTLEADPGRAVVANGAWLGERLDGGFAERAVVPQDVLVPVPEGLGAARTAAIGTAGFTAALAVLALEQHGLPDGPVLVTGAGGGVGGFAVALLAARGHEVLASTGRVDALREHLTGLGAADVVPRQDAEPGRPLQTVRWAGAIDAVGGAPLVNVLAQTAWNGAVAACGLAASAELPGTVMPFILRGVALLGVNSVEVDPERRRAAWRLMTDHLTPEVVDRLTDRTVPLAEVPAVAPDVLAGRIRGRVVVDVTA
jgi:acrylyl-CoA reductase (NADPH)